MYVRGPNPHCHPPETCPALTSEVSALVKKKALEDVFRSANDIAEEVLRSKINPNMPLSSLPAPENLARQGNCKRRTARPAEPLDLKFTISTENIPQDFLQHDIVRNAQGCQPLLDLLDYIRNTWIYSNIWPPKSWCVYGRSIHTNNDVEGWHHHINLKARKEQLNFYLLIKLLRDEAKYVTLQVRLLSDGKVLRTQRAKYTLGRV
ncbi:hypothetical protein E2C01_063614 [Portunus trituberculatus]|uniref:Uncharacterized protein n=1 Tax=Portunus trituberculatus TaxID=210409 RepID=A0A5B7H9L8_PORTR|nr:hypothetical protein [Portunus trituberculatus]